METFKNIVDSSEWLFEMVNIKYLILDVYQREIDQRRVNRYAKAFDSELFQPIDVSLRDSKYYVIDGQHRVALAKKLGIKEIGCKVHLYLNFEQEALLFESLNRQRKSPTAVESFDSLVYGGDLIATSINNILKSTGFMFRDSSSANCINAVRCVERMYKKYGPLILYRTLYLIGETWSDNEGNKGKSRDSAFISGLCHFVKLYYNEMKNNLFINKMQNVPTILILRNGKMLISAISSSVGYEHVYSRQIWDQYNKGRHHENNKLPNKYDIV